MDGVGVVGDSASHVLCCVCVCVCSYFPFEEMISDITAAFFRDPWVLENAAVHPHRAVTAVDGDSGPESEPLAVVPPCGVTPFDGVALYAAPLCFMYHVRDCCCGGCAPPSCSHHNSCAPPSGPVARVPDLPRYVGAPLVQAEHRVYAERHVAAAVQAVRGPHSALRSQGCVPHGTSRRAAPANCVPLDSFRVCWTVRSR